MKQECQQRVYFFLGGGAGGGAGFFAFSPILSRLTTLVVFDRKVRASSEALAFWGQTHTQWRIGPLRNLPGSIERTGANEALAKIRNSD